MGIQGVFTLNSLIAVPVGLLFVLFPRFLLGQVLGADVHAAGLVMARMLGGEFLCFGVITWRARYANAEAQRLIVLGCWIGFAVGTVALLWAQWTGVLNVLGWAMVVTYAFFSLAYGVLYGKLGSLGRPS